MNLPLLAALLLLGCASAPAENPPVVPPPAPAPREEPPPVPAPKEEPPPAPAPKEEPKPDPKPMPKEEPKVEPRVEPKEEPKAAPVPKTSPEAKELLLAAAKRQGTADLVGGRAPVRYGTRFSTVVIHGESRVELADTSYFFALPVPGAKEARMRSEVSVDGKRTIKGHNGRFGWMWTKDLASGDERVDRFIDPARDKADIDDVDNRRRMLRLALQVFFLGEMAESPVVVRLLPDETAKIPFGRDGKTRDVKVRVLERAADPSVGEPALRILLSAGNLDPVGVYLLPPKPELSSFLLTLDFESEAIRAKKVFPKGVRVPDWLEQFEIPVKAGEPAVLQIQAGVAGFEIDPAKVPDSLFEAPRSK